MSPESVRVAGRRLDLSLLGILFSNLRTLFLAVR